MAVYEHKSRANYKSLCYRVVRSINNETRQKYFPYTEQGRLDAEALDAQWKQEQKAAQKHFVKGGRYGRRPV